MQMTPSRKPPQKFDSMWDLINELNSAGHPNNKIWFKGEMSYGKESISLPQYFISADCRVIGQRQSDNKWTTLLGYDDPVKPGIPEPTGAHILERMEDNLQFFWPK
jgi:hypothetical protein